MQHTYTAHTIAWANAEFYRDELLRSGAPLAMRTNGRNEKNIRNKKQQAAAAARPDPRIERVKNADAESYAPALTGAVGRWPEEGLCLGLSRFASFGLGRPGGGPSGAVKGAAGAPVGAGLAGREPPPLRGRGWPPPMPESVLRSSCTCTAAAGARAERG